VKYISVFVIFLVTFFLIPSSMSANTQNYFLFYSNENATDVTRVNSSVTIELNSKEALLSLLFYKLKEKPGIENLHPAVPGGIQLKDIVLDGNGTLYLDFNDNIMNIGSRSAEHVFIKAINYTYFTNFKDINHIYYTVNGTKLSSLSHIEVSEGFARDSTK
jgi:hypothetical protein